MTLRRSSRLLLVLPAVAATLALAPSAGAATSASLEATKGCDLQVINDWADNGRVDRTYAIPCYTQAIQYLSQLPDVKSYSSAEDDIHAALLAAIRQDRGGGPGGGVGNGPSNGPSGNPSSGPGSGPGNGPSADPTSPIVKASHDLNPGGDAQSVPLPLIVLGGLALLLLLAALGTWLAKRFQGRRVTPAPAPAPARTPRP
ncbi:MAG TPA: hypothetical protein VFA56_08565 [Gaiellaceae bacterium]|nr:hypothetical protein [Gaiellaceae bacterium]